MNGCSESVSDKPVFPSRWTGFVNTDGRHPNASQPICKRELGSLVNQWYGVYTENPKVIKSLIGMCLSFQGQLNEIYPHSVSDLRAL